MKVEVAALAGIAVVWAGVWAATALLLVGSPTFAKMLPVLLAGTAGSLIVSAAAATASRPRVSPS